MSAFNFYPFPTISTGRLLLRELTSKDISVIFEMRSSKKNQLYLDRPLDKTLADSEAFFQKISKGIAENKSIMWGIELKKTSKLVGSICLWNLNMEKMIGELGYEIHPNFHGKKYSQEAVKKVLDFGFSHMNLKSIEAVSHKNNFASIRILEKNNFKKQGNLEGEDPDLLKLVKIDRASYI